VLKDTAADAELTVLVVDAVMLNSSESAIVRLRAALKERKIPRLAIVALNKIDKIAKPQLLPLLAKLAQLFTDYAEQNKTALPEFVPISALKGDGLDILEKVIVNHLPEGPAYFPKKTVSDQTEQFLAGEIIREKLTLNLEQELPYSLAVCIEQWQKEGDVLHIGALIMVEKPSQKGIVIGKGGSKLKSIGQLARTELERILGTRIFLELFVRVESNWTKTKRGLEEAGYSAETPY
jgi:GTPase